MSKVATAYTQGVPNVKKPGATLEIPAAPTLIFFITAELVPVANIGSRFGPLLAILGIAFGASAQLEEWLPIFQLITNIGLLLFAASVLFYIVTLPVEFNASRRALKILKETGTLESDEISGVRKVLWAAAMTYVASALTAIGSFLRLLVLTGRRRN